MKIQNINNLYIQNISTRTKNYSFKGLINQASECMFVFDLDGTLADGDEKEISEILDISKKRNAKIIYATGRGLEEFCSLQKELNEKGIALPKPDFLISGNGEAIYYNDCRQLNKDREYSHYLKESTNFDKEHTSKLVESISDRLTKQDSSTLMLKYQVPDDMDIKKLKENIQSKLSKNNIKILCGYSGEKTNNQTLFIAPFNKSTAIQYLQRKLEIPYDEILMAGNDNNDISMAKLSAFGAKFICLNNAKENLIKACEKLHKDFGNIYFSLSSGAKGIIEGLFDLLD